LAAAAFIGIQSAFGESVVPAMISRAVELSNADGPYGRIWKYVPFSPPGLSPILRNSAAM
jgi:hypothetical protein